MEYLFVTCESVGDVLSLKKSISWLLSPNSGEMEFRDGAINMALLTKSDIGDMINASFFHFDSIQHISMYRSMTLGEFVKENKVTLLRNIFASSDIDYPSSLDERKTAIGELKWKKSVF